MAEKVQKVGIKKEYGYLYFVDKKGNISRAVMSRGGRKKGKSKKEVVAKVGVEKEDGYLYFVDTKGDISRAKMARGRKAKKKKR
ncbi:hypothetical protein JW868_05065 [Candidatus Woesearchaeota archaeon]|nr:hypothetical protein [Candidatus Woesearchaeota archaeon]